jgi:hypothetical protein
VDGSRASACTFIDPGDVIAGKPCAYKSNPIL